MEQPTRIQFRNPDATPLGSIRQFGYIRQSKGINQRTMRVYGMYAVAYVFNGAGRYADANGVTRDIHPGDLILVFPWLAHRYGPAEGQTWSEFYISFEGPLFEMWEQTGLLDPRQPVRRLEPVDQWLHLLESVVGAAGLNTAEPPLVEIGRLQTFLAQTLTRGPGGEPTPSESAQWAARACALLETDLHADLDLHWAARRLHTSYESFRKRFTRLVGVAPHRYRTRRRVERATELIRTGRLSDKQIAASLGFCDEFHFSRKFKQLTGLSPRAYRRQHTPGPGLSHPEP